MGLFSTPLSARIGMPLLLITFAFLMNGVARGVTETFAVFLLPLASGFGWERAEMTGAYSLFMISTGLFGPLAGNLMDRYGPRVVYGLGLTAMGGGYVLASRLDALWQLYLCVGLMAGIGTASIGMIQGSVLASRWFRDRLPLALGVIYAGAGTGTLIMAPVAQTLIDSQGWRAAYQDIGIGVLALLALLVILPMGRLAAGDPELRTGRDGEAAPQTTWTLTRAMKTVAFWGCFNVFCFTSMAVFCVVPQLVAFFVESGFSPLLSAYAFGAMGFLSVGGVAGIGLAVAKFGRRNTATISYLLTLSGLVILIAIAHWPSLGLLVLYVVLFGVTQGVRGPIVGAVVARTFGGPGMGTVYGAVTIGMGIGAGLGSFASGLLHDWTGGYVASFIYSFCAALIGLSQFWLIPALRKD